MSLHSEQSGPRLPRRLFSPGAGLPRQSKSAVVKRSVTIAGHHTSISVEDVFWHHIKRLAAQHQTSVADYVATIDARRNSANLSSAVRCHVVDDLAARVFPPLTGALPPQ